LARGGRAVCRIRAGGLFRPIPGGGLGPIWRRSVARRQEPSEPDRPPGQGVTASIRMTICCPASGAVRARPPARPGRHCVDSENDPLSGVGSRARQTACPKIGFTAQLKEKKAGNAALRVSCLSCT